MSFLHGYLFLDTGSFEGNLGFPTPGTEIFNNGRTLGNMEAARVAGLLNRQIRFTGENCDCAAYDVDPNGEAIAADNPWDDGSDLASEFLGAWVFNQTGLDGAHNRRETTPRSAFPYGVNLSPLKPGGRVIEFEVTMVATSICGLDFGYEWLESELLVGGCDVCEQRSMYVRSCCPTGDDMSEGLWQLRDIGLVEGPTWGDPVSDGTTGYLRDLRVTFTAGDPCRWGDGVACIGEAPFFIEPVTELPICCEFASQRRDFRVPTVQIFTESDADPDQTNETTVTIEIWDADAVTACVGADTLRRHTTIDILPIPEGSILQLDGRLRRVLITRDNGLTYQDGSIYIDSNAGFIDWDAYACASSPFSVTQDDEVSIIIVATDPPALDTYARVVTYRRAGC